MVNRAPVQQQPMLLRAARRACLATQLKMAWAAAPARDSSRRELNPAFTARWCCPAASRQHASAVESSVAGARPKDLLRSLFARRCRELPVHEQPRAMQQRSRCATCPRRFAVNGGRDRSTHTCRSAGELLEQALRQIDALLQSRTATNGAQATATSMPGPTPLREHSACPAFPNARGRRSADRRTACPRRLRSRACQTPSSRPPLMRP